MPNPVIGDESPRGASEDMRDRLKRQKDLYLERMFETRSEAWERVGLAMESNQRAVRKARRQALILLPLLIAVLVVYYDRYRIFGLNRKHPGAAETWIQWGTVLALLALGWSA